MLVHVDEMTPETELSGDETGQLLDNESLHSLETISLTYQNYLLFILS